MGTIFSAYDIRGRIGETISKEYVWTVGKAYSDWLPDSGSIVIATAAKVDTAIAHAFVEGVLLQGRDVIDAGEGDEQVLRAVIMDSQAAGGVLISHDDIQNLEIIALYDAQGAVVSAESGLLSIGELVESGNFLPAVTKGDLVTQ